MHLAAEYVLGRMFAAVQYLYSDAHSVINISGHNGNSGATVSGMQPGGCLLRPTLVGIIIVALEGRLDHSL